MASSADPSPAFSAILVSAPGKVILHGEHAVVYGHSAVAASLGLRSRLYISPEPEGSNIVVTFPDINVSRSWTCEEVKKGVLDKMPSIAEAREPQGSERLQEIIREFLDASEESLQMTSLVCFFYLYAVVIGDGNVSVVPMHIKVESDIPIGAGLGSSAAISVSLAAGLLNVRAQLVSAASGAPTGGMDSDEICRLAHLSEKIIHGPRASGLDNTVSTHGGMVSFAAGQVSRLTASPPIKVLLVNTSVPRLTRRLVEKVARQVADSPKVINPILSAMDGISKKCVAVFEALGSASLTAEESERQYQQLERLIDYNQKLLDAIEVSHPKLDHVVSVARENGLHGKLTGAGGGGFAFVLLPPSAPAEAVKATKDRLREEGYRCWETLLEPNGVSVQRVG